MEYKYVITIYCRIEDNKTSYYCQMLSSFEDEYRALSEYLETINKTGFVMVKEADAKFTAINKEAIIKITIAPY